MRHSIEVSLHSYKHQVKAVAMKIEDESNEWVALIAGLVMLQSRRRLNCWKTARVSTTLKLNRK